MASQTLLKLGVTVALGAMVAGLVAAGLAFRGTDASIPADVDPSEVTIPAAPPVSEPPAMATDAFTRPVFHANREPGLDKAPSLPTGDPSEPADGEEGDTPPAESFVLKGVIIGDRGARVALQPPSGEAAVWAKVGDAIEGWTVEKISADRVRIRNGDDVAEIKLFQDN
jgi:hypothetical protein